MTKEDFFMQEMKETDVEKQFKNAEGEFAPPKPPTKECIEAQTSGVPVVRVGKCGIIVPGLVFGAMQCGDPCVGIHGDNGPNKSTCRCEYHKDPKNIEKTYKRMDQKFGV